MSRAPTSRATPRNSVKDRLSKRAMLLRKARKWARPVAWTVFGSVVVGLCAAAVQTVAPGGTIASLRERLGNATGGAGLLVAHIDLPRDGNTPKPLLRAALGVSEGDPILGFSVEHARQRIETLPWVAQATVERRLPGTIVVVVQEREPFAFWMKDKKLVLIDRNGNQVADQDFHRFDGKLPIVMGKGAERDAARLMKVLEPFPALSERIFASVRVGERRWNLHMKTGTDVMLPEGHEKEAVERLMQLHQEHALLDRPLAAIDMRLGDRLVLRPSPETGADAAQALPRPPSPPAVTPTVAKKPT